MHIVNEQAAQGDLLIRRVDSIPSGAQRVKRKRGERIICAHSETGHHHAIEADGVIQYQPEDPLVCYLQITGDYADLVHHRPWDTHAPIRLPRGTYELRRQREYVPGGWRRVED